MKQTDISGLNKIFESRVRLGIMSVLAANHSVDFNTLKELLEVTDGNLASHLKALEREEYVVVDKSFEGRKPNTRYSISPPGRKAFEQYLDVLERLIRMAKG